MKYRYDFEYVKNYCDSNSISERNNFNDDVGIVIVGHVRHAPEIAYFYKGLKNVVFIVDHDADKNAINHLKENGINVIENVRPSNTGFYNVNPQCSSSYAGAKYLKSIGKKYMIRMRSDQIILQLHKFIESFKFDKLGFLSYINQNTPHPQAYAFNDFNDLICEEYGIDKNKLDLSYCYVMDYCVTGPIDDMMIFYNYYEDGEFPAPAEHKLLLNYFANKKMELKNSYDYIIQNFYLILGVMAKNEIDFIMIKQNYTNWSVCLKQDSPEIYSF